MVELPTVHALSTIYYTCTLKIMTLKSHYQHALTLGHIFDAGTQDLVDKRGLCSVAAATLLCLLLGCLGSLLCFLLLWLFCRLGCRSCCRRDCSSHWVRRHGNHRCCSLQRSGIGGRSRIGGGSDVARGRCCIGVLRSSVGDRSCIRRRCRCHVRGGRSCVGGRSCISDRCSIADRIPTGCNEGHVFKSVRLLLKVLLWR